MTMTTDMTPATTVNPAPVAASNSLDLQTLQEAMQDFAWMTVNHPKTGEPTTMKIKVAGPDSDIFKSVDRRVSNKRLQALRKTRSGLTTEQLQSLDFEMVMGITLDWENVSWNNAPLAFNQDNVKMLYTQFPFIREQVNEFAGDRANFFSS